VLNLDDFIYVSFLSLISIYLFIEGHSWKNSVVCGNCENHYEPLISIINDLKEKENKKSLKTLPNGYRLIK